MDYYFIIFISIILIVIELNHRLIPRSPLILKPKNCNVVKSKNNINVNCELTIDNPHKRTEVMIPSFLIKLIPIGNKNNNKLKISNQCIPNNIQKESIHDDYWTAFIVKSQSNTTLNLNIDIINEISAVNEIELEAIWVEINWVNYGPFGRLNCLDGFVIPINELKTNFSNTLWESVDKTIDVLPIKTHILGRLDHPYDLLKKYCKEFIQYGDILTIGETPLAIMQGRYIFPSTLKVNFIARILCKGFHPTSSLATACGMQSLINLVGPSRLIFSFLIGGLLKIFGVKGMFYRLAGSQARLIDDITGTTPPYDQTIVLGPINAELFCKQASEELGVSVAVVDVNDLGKVKILASSPGCDRITLKKALISNPAGNANEHTPIVLIRP